MKWILSSKKLPEFEVPVLVTDGRKILIGHRKPSGTIYRNRPAWQWEAVGVTGYEWDWDFDSMIDNTNMITHWRRLPKLPNEKTNSLATTQTATSNTPRKEL